MEGLSQDLETEEEFEEVEDLREFDAEKVPQPLIGWLLDYWTLGYLEEYVDFTESYELLLEDLLIHARGKYFDAGNFIKQNVEAYLRSKLYLLLRNLAPVNALEKVMEKVDNLGINIRDDSMKFWMERYIGRKVLEGISEEEVRKLVVFVRNYNRTVGRYELMINLWELQNWAWENRQLLSSETLNLLEFS